MEVKKSDCPMPKEKIDVNILDFIVFKAGEIKDLLRNNNFSLEFLLFVNIKGFLKFNINDGEQEVEVMLTGSDLSEMVSKIKELDICLN